MRAHLPTVEHVPDYRNHPSMPDLYPDVIEVSVREGYASFEVDYDGALMSVKVGYGSHNGSAGLDLNDARVVYRILGEQIAEMERRAERYE